MLRTWVLVWRYSGEGTAFEGVERLSFVGKRLEESRNLMDPSVDHMNLNHWIHSRNADAFNELVQRYSGIVFGTCLRITGNRSEAEDVTQECFATLAGIPEVPASPVGSWLHRVATNGALDRIKARSRREKRESLYANENSHVAAASWIDEERAYLNDQMYAFLPDDALVVWSGYAEDLFTHEFESKARGALTQVQLTPENLDYAVQVFAEEALSTQTKAIDSGALYSRATLAQENLQLFNTIRERLQGMLPDEEFNSLDAWLMARISQLEAENVRLSRVAVN